MRTLALAAVIGVAGCAVPGSAPPGVETVRAERRADVPAPLARGETQLVVRAVPAGAAGQELTGAACVASSAYFRAEFASPARILVPDFGAESPPMTVTCRSGHGLGDRRVVAAGGLAGRPRRLAGGRHLGRHRDEFRRRASASAGAAAAAWGLPGGVPVVRYPELRVVVG